MPTFAKEMMMQEITKQFEGSPYAFFSAFDKISVADLTDYRRALEKVSKRSMVIKHALAKKIFTERNVPTAEKLLKGSVLVTFGDKDPQVISKTIVDFVKTKNQIAPTGVIFENQVFDQEFIKQLAKLPSRHELLTQVVLLVKSPISGFVTTLSAIMRGFVVALSEVKKKKEAAAQPA